MSSLLKLDPTGNYWETLRESAEGKSIENVPSSWPSLGSFDECKPERIQVIGMTNASPEWCVLLGREETSSCRRRRLLLKM